MHKETIIDFKELGERYRFTQAKQVLRADRIEEVISVLETVEHYQKQGFYVVGYVSYEASAAFDTHMTVHQQRLGSEALAYFTVHEDCERLPIPIDYQQIDMPTTWQTLTTQEQYEKAIQSIHDDIRQGNTYQVNYTVQLTTTLNPTDSLAIYNRMVVEQGASFNAYICHDDVAIISASPELFFKKEGQLLTTRPMKGTTKRGPNTWQDAYEKKWLANDAKNRSENMMIVDLLRNDMGKICQTGTVKVAKLCEVEQYSTVWQMTSTIEGQLVENISLVNLFEALYPCGSITGAPKLSTMSIINRLEPKPRGVYCGTVGICLPDDRTIFNVAIRTIQLFGDKAVYGVGGGITWDSRWQSEFEEVAQKAAVLYRRKTVFDVLTTAKVTNGEILYLSEHLKRLEESCYYFAYPFDRSVIEQGLQEILGDLTPLQDYRLQIKIAKSGEVTLDCQVLSELPEHFLHADLKLQIHDTKQSPFTYFKTTHRPHLTIGEHEVIYYNASNELLETSIGNLILVINGEWLTPEKSLGILPGIYRQHLLETGQVREAKLTLDDLVRAEAIYGCNSVRGLYHLSLKTNAFDKVK